MRTTKDVPKCKELFLEEINWMQAYKMRVGPVEKLQRILTLLWVQ